MENPSIYNKILSYPWIMSNNKILLTPFFEQPHGIFYYIWLGGKKYLNFYLEIINK